jgi:hypothetical protein
MLADAPVPTTAVALAPVPKVAVADAPVPPKGALAKLNVALGTCIETNKLLGLNTRGYFVVIVVVVGVVGLVGVSTIGSIDF